MTPAEVRNGDEVLVDAGAYILGARPRWCKVARVSPAARFPVAVFHIGEGIKGATFRFDEILDVKPKGARA